MEKLATFYAGFILYVFSGPLSLIVAVISLTSTTLVPQFARPFLDSLHHVLYFGLVRQVHLAS